MNPFRADKIVVPVDTPAVRKGSGNRGKLLISIGVSVGILVFLFRDLNFSEFSSELQKIQPLNFLPGIALLVGAMWLRAIRWRYFLPPSTRVSTAVLFEATT
ncbi:MAG: flippase-like domain-containing protein, partial [Deltaproteobacteria bacterium]|nr:flippase-like domain-containing protein [Deltaproteobacteria bacterium]